MQIGLHMGNDSDEDRPVDRLQDSVEIDFERFESRVREEGEIIKDHLKAGTFDNEQVTVGFEYEFYAVDKKTHRIRRVPRALLGYLGFEKELGLHNAELSTGIYPCNDPGIEALSRDIESKLSALQQQAAAESIRLVSDGMWTIGPEYNTTEGYLTEATHEEGLTLAINVSNAVRYHGFASSRRKTQCHAELAGATIDADSPEPVSLTTSIQPHYQCRSAGALPEQFRAALRLAGPLLALGVNSPFLPPELYDDAEPDRDVLFEEGYDEKRVPIYEGMMNPVDGPPKVRFPADIDTPEAAVDRVVEDRTIVPAEIDAGQRFDDAFVHFRHKHGSYWRWVRPVFDGATTTSANVRIEFRPLPGQPTVPDAVAFVAAFAGLVTSFHEQDHPALELAWETARDNFYAAARDGIDADLAWITVDGERTSNADLVFIDLLDAAADGLQRHGFPAHRVASWLAPLRGRIEQGRTPAGWKRQFVAARLDAGVTVADAIHDMQRAYIDHQAETLFTGHLTEWPDP